jgi:hypothetical protein
VRVLRWRDEGKMNGVDGRGDMHGEGRREREGGGGDHWCTRGVGEKLEEVRTRGGCERGLLCGGSTRGVGEGRWNGRGNENVEVVVGRGDLLVWRRSCRCARLGGGRMADPPKLFSKFVFLIFFFYQSGYFLNSLGVGGLWFKPPPLLFHFLSQKWCF